MAFFIKARMALSVDLLKPLLRCERRFMRRTSVVEMVTSTAALIHIHTPAARL